ncbi:MAG: polyprenyl synthetase family protein [bacterium]|nr:polyprenyl synthetase family protein [bacterium]
MSFRAYARRHAARVDRLLESYFRTKRKEIHARIPQIANYVDFFAQANRGGGRIRAVLAILGYETAGGKNLNEIAKVALALELFQTSILAQDDFMDKSALRRGRPSLHSVITNWHKKEKMLGDSLHFGASQAINISDIGFFLASDLIVQSKFPAENKIKAISEFNKIVTYTALGQILDINIPAERGERKEKDVLTVERFKTAEYTAIGPLTMGAYLAGARPNLIKNLYDFGMNLGIAFQIQDDLKGIFGREEETGKSAKGDIEEGKVTLLYTYAIKRAKSDKRKVLEKFYGKGSVSDTQAEEVREIFEETGARDYAVDYSKKLLEKARAIIPKLSGNAKIKELYEGLCDYVLVFK